MVKFLIDENLPYYFSFWNNEACIHVFDLKNISSDQEIWEYAQKNQLIVVTKDADFSQKILYKNPPPKVIHIRAGNLSLSELYDFLKKNWNGILEEIESNKLVNVYKDRIESVE